MSSELLESLTTEGRFDSLFDFYFANHFLCTEHYHKKQTYQLNLLNQNTLSKVYNLIVKLLFFSTTIFMDDQI